MYEILSPAHVSAGQPRIALEDTTRHGSFSQVVHKLKLVYAANLKHCLFQEASEGLSQTVRELTDIITAKLNSHCDPDAAQLGTEHMQEMLRHLLEEFQWNISAQIFELCAINARSEKATAYYNASKQQNRLKQTRSIRD